MPRLSISLVVIGLLIGACGAEAPLATSSPSHTLSTPDGPPSLPPAPSASEGARVVGWPTTRNNLAGVYSWDGSSCAGANCIIGFMHNGYGSGNLEIRVEVVSDGATPSGGMAVSVAGHDGMHERIDAQHEQWIVDIEGTTIAIRFAAEPGTTQAELAEAYAIIGSMRTEAQDNPFGFRLIFTLATDDWDSG
jgi:hypothetical protein